jgi:hypothetical protein
MNGSNGKGHVWRQVRIIAFLPLTIFLWLIGWALYCLGDQRTLARTSRTETVADLEKEEQRNDTRKTALQQVF